MNSKQLQYAVLLSETGNFSLVAEQLNISQPALSKQILSLEKELGVQLFNRNSSASVLTPAGEHFIREAKELLFREQQMLRSAERFKSKDVGAVVIGTTPFRSSYLLPKTVKNFREKYPEVQIKLKELGSDIIKKDAADGKFDLAIVNLPADESVFDITPLESDRLVLVVPNEILDKIPQLKNTTDVDFKNLEQLPFIVLTPSQEMRKLFDNLCITSSVTPQIAAEVTGLTTAWQMVCTGIGATMLPLQFVEEVMTNQEVTVIKLNNTSHLRQPAILTRKGHCVSEHAKYIIKLLTEK